LAHTAQARQEILKELYQLQAIDQETLLEGFNIGSVADVIKKTQEKRLKDAATQIEVDKQTEIAGGEAQAEVAKAQGGAGAREAIAVLKQIIGGNEPQVPSMVTPEFIQYIDSFLASPEGQSLGPDIIKAVQDYMAKVQVK
jgi:hypothetical protein